MIDMTAWKGFDAGLICRGFQYVEGETHVHGGDAELCVSGFHACPLPLDVWRYYPPTPGRVYREVELGGAQVEGDKAVARRLKVGAQVSVAGLIKAHVGIIFERARTAERPAATSGDGSTAAASGDGSTAAASGDSSTAATSGYRSTAATSGHRSTAAASGYGSTAAASGDYSTAATSGHCSTAATSGHESIAVAGGYQCAASGVDGGWLVLAERSATGRIVDLISVKVGGKKRGVRILPGVAYTLRGGKIEVQS